MLSYRIGKAHDIDDEKNVVQMEIHFQQRWMDIIENVQIFYPQKKKKMYKF